MILKHADDKSARELLLRTLADHPRLERKAAEWARDELLRHQRGVQGERDAAHYLDSYLRDDPDRMLLHDLRLVVNGVVAQIDHLMLTRGFTVYLLESKNFNGEVRISPHGEFSVRYGRGREFGIESPLEQSRRHAGPLAQLMQQLEIGSRLGTAPEFRHCVLLHPKALIHRPPAKAFDSKDVIKADQFPSWHKAVLNERVSMATFFVSAANMVSAATLREFGQKLTRQHRRADQQQLPPWVQAAVDVAMAGGTTPAQRPAAVSVTQPAPAAPANPPALAPQKPLPLTASATTPAGPDGGAAARPGERKLVCAQCGAKISFAEGKFCWNNAQRFGGLQYCREHQAGH